MRNRLIGAAVLVIAAVILIPWLVSNSRDPREQVQTLPVPQVASAGTPVVLELPALPGSSAAAASAPATSAATGMAAAAPEAVAEAGAVGSAGHSKGAAAMKGEGGLETGGAAQTSQPEPSVAAAPSTAQAATETGTPVMQEQAPAPASGTAREDGGQGGNPPAIRKGDWYLQVASFSSWKNAEQMLDKIKQAGFHAVIKVHEIEGKSWHRIIVGPFASEASAREAAQRVGAVSRTEPIVRQAGGSDG
ncbi:MAG: SPOR domain-containing protein [Gammaproteobacteria bacterium]|nr:SPOR domain-containing protein [Gammaproteobacteria bacterium]